MLFKLKDTTVEEITPHECWGGYDWEDGYVSVEVKFGNGEKYHYYRIDNEIQQQGLACVIDYLFTHLSEFPEMTQQEFINHLSVDLDKRFGYDEDEG